MAIALEEEAAATDEDHVTCEYGSRDLTVAAGVGVGDVVKAVSTSVTRLLHHGDL